MTLFEVLALALLMANLVALVLLLRRAGSSDPTFALRGSLDGISARITDLLTAGQANAGSLRDELATGSTLARGEVAARMEETSKSLTAAVAALGTAQGERSDGLARSLMEFRTVSEVQAKSLRQELVDSFGKLSLTVGGRILEQSAEQTRRLDSFGTQLGDHSVAVAEHARSLREEVGLTLTTLGASLASSLEAAATRQAEGLAVVANAVKEMTAANLLGQDALKQAVEGKLDAIRSENTAKLEEMRMTVDEKLQGTLEARLGASFTLVNENLERVYKSVGEMQTIASGVGDLKRVLTNVKSRGTWGEVTLGLLLEQVMTPEQYAENVEIRPNSGLRVEYAIKLPGDADQPLWLPIDAKMPTEDYERLVEASERGDAVAVEQAVKGIEKAIKIAAKDICEKYICPPHSTDFAIMFLPNEGIYAEVVRRPGLVDALQRECRVSVAGPTNLMAMLTSFRMGFKTLAIQQRSSEVWKVLGNTKHEFGKFGAALEKVEKKL